MKLIQALIFFLLISSTSFAQKDFSESITKKEIKDHVYYLASDQLEGRNTGEPGQKKAAEYIAGKFKEYGLLPLNQSQDSGYYQVFNYKKDLSTENVIGSIPSGKKDAEWIVITAHYDHIGKEGDKIFNGADDNASGTSALLEIAEACMMAKKNGNRFNKNILFIAFSAEELGLVGAKYFVNSAVADTIKMVLNINMDMIGKSIKYGMIETFKEAENTKFKEDPDLREDYVYLFREGDQTRKYSRFAKKKCKKQTVYDR